MEFFQHEFIIAVIVSLICFRLEVEGANSTPELTSEQKQDCVKWKEFNSGYCPPGTYKNDTVGECLNCPEGSYMKWFNTCPMCIRFTVCDEGDVVSCPGDTTKDRSCADPQPATDPQLIIDSPTPSESKKHKPYTEGSTSPTPDDLPDPTSKNISHDVSSDPPATGIQWNKFYKYSFVIIVIFALVIGFVIGKYWSSRTQNLSQRESFSSTSATNNTSENDKESNASLIAPNSNSGVIIEMERACDSDVMVQS